MIVIGGENLIDLVNSSEVDGLPAYVAHPGGSPFNVAMAAGRQGAAVTYLTPISQDRLGDLLAERLTSSGVILGAARVIQPTSLAVVSLKDGIPSYGFYRDGTAERQIFREQLDAALPTDTKIFHVGSLGLTDGADAAVWEDFFGHCKQNGILVSIDPNVRPSLVSDAPGYRARVKRMMDNADVLKLSDEDMCWLYETEDFDTAKAACLGDSGAKINVFTRGDYGADVVAGEITFMVAAAPVETLADTVGAGDTFMATMLAWLVANDVCSRDAIGALDEAGIKACLERAAKAAAINCSRHGCNPPTFDELA